MELHREPVQFHELSVSWVPCQRSWPLPSVQCPHGKPYPIRVGGDRACVHPSPAAASNDTDIGTRPHPQLPRHWR